MACFWHSGIIRATMPCRRINAAFLFVVPCMSILIGLAAGAVTFPDANLEAAVREALNKPAGSITESDLASLTEFGFNDRNVTDLEGLQHCVNLTRLHFANNGVSDLTPIQGLTKISDFCAHTNRISDIAPLASMTTMKEIDLGGNMVTDLEPLATMPFLRRLWSKPEATDELPLIERPAGSFHHD